MATAIPTGVVSFLFTDVEGSTRLWDADPDTMAASLELHDAVTRRVVESNGGHVFSTAGDAFAVAFASIDGAVRSATQIQLQLLRADWPGPRITVRMGIHTGSAEERGGDYFGPVLNRAARIMSAGHGGQILLSSVAGDGFSLDGAVTLNDLGTHHLKDLAEPEHVFEIRHRDLPVVERPIRTVDVRRHNLPDYLTSFVGRDAQLEELAGLIGTSRLVSLTGVGGTGKSRLAVEACQKLPLGRNDVRNPLPKAIAIHVAQADRVSPTDFVPVTRANSTQRGAQALAVDRPAIHQAVFRQMPGANDVRAVAEHQVRADLDAPIREHVDFGKYGGRVDHNSRSDDVRRAGIQNPARNVVQLVGVAADDHRVPSVGPAKKAGHDLEIGG